MRNEARNDFLALNEDQCFASRTTIGADLVDTVNFGEPTLRDAVVNGWLLAASEPKAPVRRQSIMGMALVFSSISHNFPPLSPI